jgi:hypothetical protein
MSHHGIAKILCASLAMKRRSLDGDIRLKLDAFPSFDPFDVSYPRKRG